MNYYLSAFKNYVNFSGKATRTEFWFFVLFNFLIFVLFSIITDFLTYSIFPFLGEIINSLIFLFSLFLVIPSISIMVRRLNDAGISGWMVLLILIPFIGIIVLFILFLLGSTDESANIKEIAKPETKNNKIIKYLKENKDNYSQENLISELKKAGYKDFEIKENIDIVYNVNTQNKNEKNINDDLWFLDREKESKIIKTETKKEKNTKNLKELSIIINHIIIKWFPIIGMLFIVGGISYLFYDGLWKNINELGRLIIGFVLGFSFILAGYKFKNKLHGFGDAVIGGGILIMYITLIYGSHFQELKTIMIPELLALFISLIFALSISFYAYKRNSKYILILGIIGGYLTPFFVGNTGDFYELIDINASFKSNLNLPIFLIYFLAIGLTMFIVSNKMFLKGIGLLNSIGLFVGTFLLIMSVGSNEFKENAIILSAFSILVVIMHIAAMVVNAKKFKSETDPYLISGYILPLIWFIMMVHTFIDQSFSNLINMGLLATISAAYFSAWYYLRNITNSNNHFVLYICGQISLVIALIYIIPDLNEYQGLFLSTISLIFLGLYKKQQLISREVSMLLFALAGVFFNLIILDDISFDGIGPISGKSIFIILTLIPFILMSPMSRLLKDNGKFLDLRKILGYISSVLIILILFIDIFNWKNIPFEFLFLTIPAFILVLAGIIQKQDDIKLKLLNTGSWIGSIASLRYMYLMIFPQSNHLFLSTKESLMGISSFIILILAKYSYKNLIKKNIIIKMPIIINSIYPIFLITTTYEIIGILNSLNLDFSDETIKGIKIFMITIWWIIISLLMLLFPDTSEDNRTKKKLGFFLLLIAIIKLIFYDLSNINTNFKMISFIILGILIMLVSYIVNKKNKTQQNYKNHTC